ncbi:hypothetical protein G6F61_014592 [Rhizopus arrhizus]|nr:hypothetical protein G6F61_014592 [Rhizopus arrhizus]
MLMRAPSALAGPAPSYEVTWLLPTLTIASEPAAAGCTSYGTPALVSAAVAMSQELVNLRTATGSNWKEQVFGSAMTSAGELVRASSMAGLAKWVRPLKIGM